MGTAGERGLCPEGAKSSTRFAMAPLRYSRCQVWVIVSAKGEGIGDAAFRIWAMWRSAIT
jgi:hypothetical protein